MRTAKFKYRIVLSQGDDALFVVFDGHDAKEIKVIADVVYRRGMIYKFAHRDDAAESGWRQVEPRDFGRE